jgi:hypothetical protein
MGTTFQLAEFILGQRNEGYRRGILGPHLRQIWAARNVNIQLFSPYPNNTVRFSVAQ